MPKARKHYIKNADLLREIHRCKLSYCSYVDPADSDYHLIVQTMTKGGEKGALTYSAISPVEAIKLNLTDEALATINAKRDDPLGPDEIVVRVMTFEHIPASEEDVKRRNRSTGEKHPTMTFPPFKHFRMIDGEWTEVLRSHWVGGLENGHFDNHAGRVSDSLARAYMLLVERYARKGNWAGYSYVDEMRSHGLYQLLEAGLRFDESQSTNPVAFLTTCMTNAFMRKLNDEKRQQAIRDDSLIMAGMAPSLGRQIEEEINARILEEGGKITAPPRRRGPPVKIK